MPTIIPGEPVAVAAAAASTAVRVVSAASSTQSNCNQSEGKGRDNDFPVEMNIPLVKSEEEEIQVQVQMPSDMKDGGELKEVKKHSACASVSPNADLMMLPEQSNANTSIKLEHSSSRPESQPLPVGAQPQSSQPNTHHYQEGQQNKASVSEREETSPPSAPSSYPSHPPPPPPPHGQHQHQTHPSYAQYYQHYPHGHAHYYYPHGPYYPPPPHHSHTGHQSYPHNPHHTHAYYAHYPPPGYYPPPHHYYYPHAPATATSSSPESGASGVSGAGDSAKQSSSTSPPPHSSHSSQSKNSPSLANSKPYSAFSSPPVSSAAKGTRVSTKAAPTSSPSSSIPKSKSKPAQSTTTASNRSKRKAPESSSSSTTIFRTSEKRSKQNLSSTRAAAAAIAARRAQVKEKAKQELPKTVLDRRSRKNAQSRMRAARLKQRITAIRAKDPKDRTPEEATALSVFEERRQRKNGRSRERALERKREYERIMSVPEDKWNEDQKNFVQETMVAKFKKNEGDRLRRKKLKEEFDCSTTGSLSSDWGASTCEESLESSSKKPSFHPPKTQGQTSKSGIPDYIESTRVHYEQPPQSQSQSQQAQSQSNSNVQPYAHNREAPCTPVSQKEVNSLLDSTPMNFFGEKGDCFSPNLIFPSPSRNTQPRDLSASMDSIDFDSLELPTDGTSILDSSMAINIDDAVMYSPSLKTPTINNSNEGGSRHHTLQPSGQHSIPNLSSKIVLSPVALQKRSRTSCNTNHENSTSISKAEHSHGIEVDFSADVCDLHDFSFPEDFDTHGSGRMNGGSKAITVSFSTDTV